MNFPNAFSVVITRPFLFAMANSVPISFELVVAVLFIENIIIGA